MPLTKNWQPLEKVLKDTRPNAINAGIEENLVETRVNPRTHVREVRSSKSEQDILETLRADPINVPKLKEHLRRRPISINKGRPR